MDYKKSIKVLFFRVIRMKPTLMIIFILMILAQSAGAVEYTDCTSAEG